MIVNDLIAFEQEVAKAYDMGIIRSPVHLSGGNEKQLIEIFQDISPDDWVLSTWRNHYHALLHGISSYELMRQILAGRSMYVNSPDHRFYASSIAGGICPIAVGLGMAIKLNGGKRKVWTFVGDMMAYSGIFHESVQYGKNFELPITFIVEDNGKSVLSDTCETWGDRNPVSIGGIAKMDNVIRYAYTLSWPHHGTGQWKPF